MHIQELVKSSRSFRRFDERVEIPEKKQRKWLEALRYIPSARNLQPLRYVVVRSFEARERFFPLLGWAAYLKGKGTPQQGERPTLYVVIGYDTRLSPSLPAIDIGIAAQTLLLLARADGYGGCVIGSFDPEKIKNLLEVDDHFGVGLVVALGKPKEKIKIVPVTGSIEYYRDEKGTHYVPKRALSELWIKTL
ncbi:nitroreductase family protein [Thermospira aquatica]|uniref:Nitroreductase family protein n=1 Tax=Thermospira aquatica TaxID=2828656 RepID=A0AAX3BG96_9SPIR|nr:nitroreductase family protein [Thermospira aquatica]URA11249.1 nitroreductase family protein [Thermospira aquatica]